MGEHWHARVETSDGRPLGNGFLITNRQVLTCAHVIAGSADTRVTFPASGCRGKVVDVRIGPWGGAKADPGDVAVLTLDDGVAATPARLARRHALAEARARTLTTYGFPPGYDREGCHTELRAPHRALLMGEWEQLEAVAAHGMNLQKGFSGAAVTFANTGEVVGMVTAADPDPGRRLGRMLPLDKLVQYWPPLAELLPVGPLPPGAGKALRELLERVVGVDPRRAYEAALPDQLGPPAEDFASLWAVARFLADEVAEPERALARLCATAAQRAEPGLRRDLEAWVRNELPARSAAPPAAAAPTAAAPAAAARDAAARDAATAEIVVRLAPSASGPRRLLLTIWTRVAGRQDARQEHCATLRAGDVRRHVEELLPGLMGAIPDDAYPPRVEFVLPRAWLGKPVDEWYLDRDEKVPLGWWHPVVVRDLGRLTRPDGYRRVHQRWARLVAAAGTRPVPVDCRDRRDKRSFAAWLAEDPDRGALAMANPPAPGGLTTGTLWAGLYAGVPVILWRRRHCTEHTNPDGNGPSDAECSGDVFLRELLSELGEVHVEDLPERVRRLRAAHGADTDSGAALTLLWDDPRRTPAVDDIPVLTG